MKHHKLFTQITTIFFLVLNVATAQNVTYRNPQLKEILTPFRMPLIDRKTIEYVNLDEDKDPDAMKATLVNGKKILWIDDDDDMAIGDVEGDMDNDCLMIDINGDGKYGDYLDLNIDYIDGDGDGKADYQILVDNGKKEFKDNKQRLAVCYSLFKRKNEEKEQITVITKIEDKLNKVESFVDLTF
jgi:hypothetical protein